LEITIDRLFTDPDEASPYEHMLSNPMYSFLSNFSIMLAMPAPPVRKVAKPFSQIRHIGD
jgi:hypothetical protein